jgi:hypothetical protein
MNSYDLSGEFGRAGVDVRHRFSLFGTINLPWWKLVVNPLVTANTGRPFNITTGQDLNLDRQYNERPTFAQLNAYCTTFPARCTTFDYSSTSNQFIPRNYGNSPGYFRADLTVSRTFSWGGERARASNSQRGGGNTADNKRGGAAGGGRGGPSIGSSIPKGPGGPGGGEGGGQRVMMMGGPGGGGGGVGKYSLNVSINAQNLFNRVNLDSPVGVLTSPNFGQSLGLAGSFGGFGPFGGGGGGGGAGNRRIYLRLRFTF